MKSSKILAATLFSLAMAATAQAAITYVDADGTNTTNTTNWNFRSLGNNNNVYESQSSNGAEMVTTITALSALTDYEIYGFYWGSSDTGSWTTEFGTVSSNLTAYDESGTLASSLTYTTVPMFTEGNRTMYAASLGTVQSDSNGEIRVYIDDNSTTNNFSRAWYDGVGYSVIPEPATAFLGGLGLLALLRRRR